MASIHTGFLCHGSQHHLRVIYEITVVGDSVLVFFHGKPRCIPFIRYDFLLPLFQKQYVRGHFCSCHLFESIFRQTDGTDQFRPLCDILPHRLVLLIHCEFCGNDCKDASASYLIQTFRQKIIVYLEVITVIPPVTDFNIMKRYIAHHHIKEAVGKLCVLIPFDKNVCLRI